MDLYIIRPAFVLQVHHGQMQSFYAAINNWDCISIASARKDDIQQFPSNVQL